MKNTVYDIIRIPVITEKSTIMSEGLNKYSFEVATSATKDQIKKAVESIFGVKVLSVNTMNVAGKVKRFKGRLGKRSDRKKAIVTVEPGKTIDLSAGV